MRGQDHAIEADPATASLKRAERPKFVVICTGR